ncbi:MAG: hypothetical protein NTZ61_14675, partial [Proteobacteria bacterium]|nr:hypothetical protein [Pseudomonadota bacterium]
MLTPRRSSLRGPSFRVLGVAAPLLLTLLGIGPCERRIIEIGLPTLAGALPVEITLPSGTNPADATVALDGVDVTASFSAGGAGLVGSVPVPAPGEHEIDITRPFSALPALSFSLTN